VGGRSLARLKRNQATPREALHSRLDHKMWRLERAYRPRRHQTITPDFELIELDVTRSYCGQIHILKATLFTLLGIWQLKLKY
jgi:hypothetical protein